MAEQYEEDAAMEQVFKFHRENPRFSPDTIRQARSGLISPDQIVLSTDLDVKLPPGANEQDFVDNIVPKIKPHMDKLQMAHMRFSVWPELYGKSNMSKEVEPHYQAFHQDILEHDAVWFKYIFHEDTTNADHCTHAVGILGTYCTLLRQRNDLEDCGKVMDTYTKVVHQLQKMSHPSRCNDAIRMNTCKVLTYKYFMIRINLGYQLGDKPMTVEAVRHVVGYEQELLGDVEPGAYGTGTAGDYQKLFLGKDLTEWRDGEIWSIIKKLNKNNVHRLDVSECANCDKEEKVLHYLQKEFKFCAGCKGSKRVMYCSRECQKDHWKIHKILCGDNNTTNLDVITFMNIAEPLIGMFAEQVLNKSVPESEKKALMPGLLKHMKTLLASARYKECRDESELMETDFLSVVCRYLSGKIMR